MIRLASWKGLSGNSAKDGTKKYEARRKQEYLVATTDARHNELYLGSNNRYSNIVDIYFVLSCWLCAKFRIKNINSRVI